MSSAGCSWPSKLCSTWGPGYVGTVTDFVERVNNKRKYQYHIRKAWTAWDKAEMGLFSHAWVILEIQSVHQKNVEYLSVHRFEEEDLVYRFDSFNEALRDCTVRKTTNPSSSIFFEAKAKSALTMLDYILGGLMHIHGTGYHFTRNNCQIFAADLKEYIQFAAKLTNMPPSQSSLCQVYKIAYEKWQPRNVSVLSAVCRDLSDNRARSVCHISAVGM